MMISLSTGTEGKQRRAAQVAFGSMVINLSQLQLHFFFSFSFLRVGRRIADPSAGRLYGHKERGFILCLDTPAVLTCFCPAPS